MQKGFASTSGRNRSMVYFAKGPSISRHSEGQGEEHGMSEDCRAVCLLVSPCGGGMIQASDQVRGVGGMKGHCLAKTRWSWWGATSLLSTRDTALPLWLHKQKP